jgi:hypothetical protein
VELVCIQIRCFRVLREDSRARVSVRGDYFVDNMNISLGAYRQGLCECARDSSQGEEKASKLKHRKEIEGAERQQAWGNPQRQCNILYVGGWRQ